MRGMPFHEYLPGRLPGERSRRWYHLTKRCPTPIRNSLAVDGLPVFDEMGTLLERA